MKKIRNKSLMKIIKASILLLTILVVILVIIEYPPGKNIEILKKTSEYSIKDECSVVVGRLIHKIKDEGECKIKCSQECIIRGQKISDYKFIESQTDCNTCKCYCK